MGWWTDLRRRFSRRASTTPPTAAPREADRLEADLDARRHQAQQRARMHQAQDFGSYG
ncbi:hypothetical protein G7070_12600 [Propioniciclava coleopterorum]|uniref:Uncharacterized protein n=1 Tax=Propioniciclava coleopterorum TaxID=2714937 RepID=A0A6G7Y834_9ACTN|nr:hypothetical protein [Propioniciclava coleopterorum]QIK72953.1 hypothetical protein G7070_12600 [Propioniciclava coleopterorum]